MNVIESVRTLTLSVYKALDALKLLDITKVA